MKGLASVIKDRRLTAPQLRVLLGQLESRDSYLRDELAAIERLNSTVYVPAWSKRS